MNLLRYTGSPAYPNLKQRASKGIAVTGFDGSSFLMFANYNDAALAAQAVSKIGEEGGQVFQLLMDDATNTQISSGAGKKIKRSDRPEMAPAGQFSLFYVPVDLNHDQMAQLLPELHAEGKVLDRDDSKISRVITDLKQSRSPP